MKENNSGFSLIELIVALAIVAIVSGAVMGFAVISSQAYQRQNKEVEMQYEAQLAMNQLQDLVIDAQKGIAYSVNDGAVQVLKDDEIDSVVVPSINSKEITIYNDRRYYVVKWDATKNELRYSESHQKPAPDDTWVEDADEVLMAKYVNDFIVDLSDMDKNGSVRLKLVFSKGKDYEVIQNVFLRNKVAVNPTFGEMY